MVTVKTIFQFTCDNEQLALDEVELQIKNAGLTAENMEVIDSEEVENREPDGFDDYIFKIRADVTSDKLSESEIKTAIEKGSFESYEFDERDYNERKKMVLAMEFICRHINDEDIFTDWLMYGVADGDVPHGSFNTEILDDDDTLIDDDNFGDLMGCFLRRMAAAKQSGGLYCDNISST